MTEKNAEEFQIEDLNSEFLFDIYVDVQNRLHITQKVQKPTLPKYVPVTRLPNIEQFMPSLEKELAEKDITPEERARMAAEEQARIEAEQKAKEEAERKAKEEAEAKAKAEEQAKLEAERKAQEEAERLAKEQAEKEEQERIEAERKAQEEAEAQAKAEEEARLEAERKAQEEAEAQAKAEEEARLAEEQAKLEEEKRAQEEAERLAKEEAERKAQEEAEAKASAPTYEKISVISFDTLKGKKKPIVSRSAMQQGGVAAIKAEATKQKSELDAIRREEAQERAQKRKIEKEQEALNRLPNAILIGNTKVPSPELGRFEIVSSGDPEKPFKFVLKTETGKTVFETSPMRTKPNELTAVMFKDIMQKGSFTFTRSITGAIVFKVLDARGRVFYTSRSYMALNDAQRAAALIKKYGLSANYIDDTTI